MFVDLIFALQTFVRRTLTLTLPTFFHKNNAFLFSRIFFYKQHTWRGILRFVKGHKSGSLGRECTINANIKNFYFLKSNFFGGFGIENSNSEHRFMKFQVLSAILTT